MSILPFLPILPVVLAACAPGGSPQAGAESGDVPFEVLVEETYSAYEEPVREVVRDADAWAAAWDRLRGTREPAPPRPEVDFAEEIVVVAALGTKPTGGYGIAVERVARDGADLTVHVVETRPGPGCMLMQALTSPATAIRLPRPEGTVTFEARTDTVAC